MKPLLEVADLKTHYPVRKGFLGGIGAHVAVQVAKVTGKDARVVVLDYPVFYQLNTFCIGLSATSHAKIDEGINLLDSVISSATSRHGFTFGDVRSAFVGHQLCSGGTKWLHALNFTDLDESYHPTAAGQSGGYLPVLTTDAG